MDNKLLKEYYIKNVCSVFFPNKYKDLIKTERPDFKNSELGLEVCEAVQNYNAQVRSFYRKNVRKDYSDIANSARKIGFKSLKHSDDSKLYSQSNDTNQSLYYLSLNNGKKILCGRSSANIDWAFQKTLKHHLNQLQGYQQLRKYDIAIYFEETLDYIACREEIIDSVVKNSVEVIRKIYFGINLVRKFNHIILIYLTHIVFVDTVTWNYHIDEISEKTRRECWQEAVSQVQTGNIK